LNKAEGGGSSARGKKGNGRGCTRGGETLDRHTLHKGGRPPSKGKPMTFGERKMGGAKKLAQTSPKEKRVTRGGGAVVNRNEEAGKSRNRGERRRSGSSTKHTQDYWGRSTSENSKHQFKETGWEKSTE